MGHFSSKGTKCKYVITTHPWSGLGPGRPLPVSGLGGSSPIPPGLLGVGNVSPDAGSHICSKSSMVNVMLTIVQRGLLKPAITSHEAVTENVAALQTKLFVIAATNPAANLDCKNRRRCSIWKTL